MTHDAPRLSGPCYWLAGALHLALAASALGQGSSAPASLLAPGAAVEKLADGFTFLEGPAADAAGNVYFTDVRENRIHRYSVDRELSIVREDTGGANGLAFDPQGHLIACAGGERQLLSFGNVSRAGASEVVVLAERFDGKKLNSPNDLWIDAAGGIYFTDPRYGGPGEPIEQDGEHVYYLTPDRTRLQRVADDLTKPNGIIGSRDGKTLYVASTQPQQTYAYVIGENGTLSGKRIFAEQGSDGVTLDERGNLYLTWLDGVSIYSPSGEKLETIAVPEWAANVAFGGPDHSTLFITARTGLYAVRMSVRGQRADR